MNVLALFLGAVLLAVAAGCALVCGAAIAAIPRRRQAPGGIGIAEARLREAGMLLELQLEIELLRERVEFQETRLRCLVAQCQDARDLAVCPICRSAADLRG